METNINTIIARLKRAVEESNLSYAQLEQKSGVPKSNIQRYVTGQTKKIPIDNLKAIARALNVSASYLMGWDSDKDSSAPGTEAVPVQITGFIPVYGEIPAGVPAFEEQRIIDYISTTYAHPDEYFGLKVKGTSMINAGIPNGCYVTIHKQNYADNGDIVACRVNGEEVTLKRFRQQGGTVMLIPENPEYSPILINASDFSDGSAQIIGVATDVTLKLKG